MIGNANTEVMGPNDAAMGRAPVAYSDRRKAAQQRLTMAVLWLGIVVSICLVLATRRLYVVWDDANYLAEFTHPREYGVGWWRLLIEEPGWTLLTTTLRGITTPETGYRCVHFAAPLMLFLGSNRLIGGKWFTVTRGSWLFLLGFFLDREVGAMGYIASVRQGLADALFIFLMALRAPAVVSALGAASVHSAMLVVAPVIVFLRGLFRYKWLAAAAAGLVILYAVLLLLKLAPSPLTGADLGRRENSYEFASGLNLFGYTEMVLKYAPFLWLLRKSRSPWYAITLIAAPMMLALSVASPGFIRLVLTVDLFALMAACTAPNTRETRAGIIYWMVANVAIGVWTGLHADPRDSWLGLWSLALGL